MKQVIIFFIFLTVLTAFFAISHAVIVIVNGGEFSSMFKYFPHLFISMVAMEAAILIQAKLYWDKRKKEDPKKTDHEIF